MDLLGSQTFDFGVIGNVTGNVTPAAVLKNCKIRLYQTDIALDRNTTLSALNSASCTFTGYGDQTVTWAAGSLSEEEVPESIGTTPAYRPTDGVTPNNVYGCYLVDQAGDLCLFGRFDNAPIPMANALNQLTVTLRYRPKQASIGVTVG